MSDQSGGVGWWMAVDGKWYPPQLHPNYETLQRELQAAGPTSPAAPRPRGRLEYSGSAIKNPGRGVSDGGDRRLGILLARSLAALLFVSIASLRACTYANDDSASSTTSKAPADLAAPAASGATTTAKSDRVDASACRVSAADIEKAGGIPARPTADDHREHRGYATIQPDPTWKTIGVQGWTEATTSRFVVYVGSDYTAVPMEEARKTAIDREGGTIVGESTVLSTSGRLLTVLDYTTVDPDDETVYREREYADFCGKHRAWARVSAEATDFDATIASIEPFLRTLAVI